MSNGDGGKLNRDDFRKVLSQVQGVLRTAGTPSEVDSRTLRSAKKWIENKCAEMMFTDPSYYLENGIDSILWKDRFYRPIEHERSSLSNSAGPSPTERKSLLTLINEGIEYYTHLIKRLRDSSTVELGDRSSPFSKHTKVLLSYNLIIHLGDLYRYQALALPPPTDSSSRFKDAEVMYKQAIALDPSNGLGHHQLAVLSTYDDATCMAIYRYCRSLACKAPYSSAHRNLRVLLAKNEKLYFKEKEQNLNDMNKKQLLNFFITEFVELQKLLFDRVPNDDVFNNVFKECIALLSSPFSLLANIDKLLHVDAASAPLIFRIVMIAIFMADDGWKQDEDVSASALTSQISALAWSVLFQVVAVIIRNTGITISIHIKEKLLLRHMPTIALFVVWLQKQQSDGYRPRYINSDMFNVSGQHQRYSLFIQSEWMIWKELVGLLNRIPLKEINNDKRDSMFYEVELRGFLPFKGAYDKISCSQVITNPTECENRCMQMFLTLMECVIQDPRCPVEVIQKANEFTLTYNHSIPSVASLSSLDIALQASTSLSVSPEDAIPFSVFSNSLSGFHSRHVSGISVFSPTHSRSSSRSASGLNRARVSSTTSLKSHSSDMREGIEQDSSGRDETVSPFLLDVPSELKI